MNKYYICICSSLGDGWILDIDTLCWYVLPDSMQGRPRLWYASATVDSCVYIHAGVRNNIFDDNCPTVSDIS